MKALKTFSLRVVLLLAVLLLLWPGVPPANSAWANPFVLRIVDAESGEGLARVRVTSDEGYVCYTRPDGTVSWTESSLMGRDVRFQVDAAGARRAVTAHVTPGGHAEFTVR